MVTFGYAGLNQTDGTTISLLTGQHLLLLVPLADWYGF